MAPRSKEAQLEEAPLHHVYQEEVDMQPESSNSIIISDRPFYDEQSHDDDESGPSTTTIRFALHMHVFDILCREEYSEDERAASYYTADEITAINDAQSDAADRMASGKKAKKSSPYRGLEAWTDQGQLAMNERIFTCVDAVLDEQEQQWINGISSRKRVAKVSKTFSGASTQIALDLAKHDAKDAKKAYRKDLEDSERSLFSEQQGDTLSSSLRMSIQASPLMAPKKKVTISARKLRKGQRKSSNNSSTSSINSSTSNKDSSKQPKSPVTTQKKKIKKSNSKKVPKSPKSPIPTSKKAELPQSGGGFWSLSVGSPSLFDSTSSKSKKNKKSKPPKSPTRSSNLLSPGKLRKAFFSKARADTILEPQPETTSRQ